MAGVLPAQQIGNMSSFLQKDTTPLHSRRCSKWRERGPLHPLCVPLVLYPHTDDNLHTTVLEIGQVLLLLCTTHYISNTVSFKFYSDPLK